MLSVRGTLVVEPDLRAVVSAFTDAGADFVLIGGFAVIAHEVLRTTEDCDLLIPDDATNDAAVFSAAQSLTATPQDGQPLSLELITQRESLRLSSDTSGMLDLLRGGLPPLDFASVKATAIEGTLGELNFSIAGLPSLVAFKRLAGRAQDHADLEKLEQIHGPLPEG